MLTTVVVSVVVALAADVVIDDALVIKGKAPVVEVCRRVPLKNGRVGETVVVCERVRGGK